uniref:Uncharacterized protein n=1 Tax=Acrobeloides nanus TaxID=290746 RepID=A0A914ENH8_9BILA
MIFIDKIVDILAKADHEIVVYQPIYDENITYTSTNHARIIERERDFIPSASLADMQPDIWSLEPEQENVFF